MNKSRTTALLLLLLAALVPVPGVWTILINQPFLGLFISINHLVYAIVIMRLIDNQG